MNPAVNKQESEVVERLGIMLDCDAREALRLTEELIAAHDQPQFLCALEIIAAKACRRLGDTLAAAQHVAIGEFLAEHNGLVEHLVELRLVASFLHFDEKQPQQTYTVLDEALLLASRAGNKGLSGGVLVTWGHFALRLRQLGNARTWTEWGLEFLAGSVDRRAKRFKSNGHQTIAQVCRKLGELGPAETAYALAWANSDPREKKWCARLQWQRSDVAEEMGRIDDALVFVLPVREILTDHPLERALVQIDVGRLSLKLGKEAAAEVAAAQAILKEQAATSELARRALNHIAGPPHSVDVVALWEASKELKMD